MRARVRPTRKAAAAAEAVAEVDPVARVLVDVPLAHLDRTFDYAVPASMAEEARPGVRVKVRFAGRDVDGFVLERAAGDRPRRLADAAAAGGQRRAGAAARRWRPSPAELAERYAGTRSDVLRLAVPGRHAATEKKESVAAVPPPAYDSAAAEAAWADHAPGAAYLGHLAGGGTPRAVWGAAPGTDWPTLVAHAVAATLAGGRGALVVRPRRQGRRPGRRRADRGAGCRPARRADRGRRPGPALPRLPRRRARSPAGRGRHPRRGVRAGRGLGLVVIWDDGDDLHAEPRAPYPHARETLLLRAEREGAAALVGGFAIERRGRAAGPLGLGAPARRAPRGAARRGSPCRSRAPTSTRWPATRWRGPPGCRPRCTTPSATPSRPARCSCRPRAAATPRRWPASGAAPRPAAGSAPGPLALGSATAPPTCRWCGAADEAWACPECGHRGLRAPVVGETRTAEELGRRFPGTVVRTSGGDRVLASVDDEPAIVVATPGAEPVAEGGYAAVVLLDTWLALGLADLRAEEEALRRWCNAVGLVRPGGRAVVVGDPAHPAVQALVRWDPAGFAAREAAPAPGGAPAAGVPAGHDHRRAGRRRRRADPAGAAGRLRGAGPGAGRPRRGVPCRRARAARPRRRAVPRARRGAAGPLGAQARRRPHPGRTRRP